MHVGDAISFKIASPACDFIFYFIFFIKYHLSLKSHVQHAILSLKLYVQHAILPHNHHLTITDRKSVV